MSDQTIIRKALEVQHRQAFTIIRAEAGSQEEDTRTIELSFASDTPITHFMWERWEYVDIQLSMDPKAVRTDRLKAGAAFLMDHNPGDQRGVVDSFSIKAPKSRATIRLSRSERGQELYQDILDGIRTQISLGFMIHKLTLIEERKGEPDLYRADDWEPFEISSVSIAADIGVGVGRSLSKRDGNAEDMCPDCEIPFDECPCEESVSQAARSKRAISTKTEKTMSDKNDNTPGTPVVEVRSENELAAEEILRWGKKLGQEDLARYHAAAEKPNVEEFRKAARDRTPAPTPVPQPSADDAASRQGGGGGLLGFGENQAGEVVVDRKTRDIVEASGFGLTERQMATICTKEYRDAFTKYLRRKGVHGLSQAEVRSLSEGTDSEGGFLVPAEFMAKMVEREPATTALQGLVTQLQTGSDKLILPKNNYSSSNLYTTGVRVNWVDEKTGPGSEEDATDFGNVTIPIHTAMMYHDVTNNMIEDSAFDILGWLTSKFRETADVVTEDMIINGTGIGKPAGVLQNPGGTNQPATVASGSGSTLTADGIMDLAYSLLGRYIANARFIFNRTSTEKTIAKLKDGDNRYLFAAGVNSDGLATARPTSLVGFPILSSDFMPDVAASAYPIIFGDPRGYYLVRRIGFSIQVLNEIVATSNKVRVLGRMRIGGQVAEDWRLKVQVVST